MSERSGSSAEDRVLRACRRHRLFPESARVLVATGGGLASLGLLAFLHRARERLGIQKLMAVCVDHSSTLHNEMIAVEQAERVADTGRLVRALGIEFFALSQERGSTIAALKANFSGLGADVIALGSTREDNAARVLSRILLRPRTAFLAHDILLPRRTRSYVRPLLDESRETALLFARQSGLEPLVDPVGALPQRSRDNRIRDRVLARLKAEFSGTDESLVALAQGARADRQLLVEQARMWWRPLAPQWDKHHAELPRVLTSRTLAVLAARQVLVDHFGLRRVQHDRVENLAQWFTMPRSRRMQEGSMVLGTEFLVTARPDTVRIVRRTRSKP